MQKYHEETTYSMRVTPRAKIVSLRTRGIAFVCLEYFVVSSFFSQRKTRRKACATKPHLYCPKAAQTWRHIVKIVLGL